MDWFDELQKKKEKGMRKLSQFLEENGFSIVGEESGGKHIKIKVRKLDEKDDVDAETVVTTVSHKTTNTSGKGRFKMVLREIENLFKGRKRRGQGDVKLSENYKQETWTAKESRPVGNNGAILQKRPPPDHSPQDRTPQVRESKGYHHIDRAGSGRPHHVSQSAQCIPQADGPRPCSWVPFYSQGDRKPVRFYSEIVPISWSRDTSRARG